jgi:hypothetical protein
VRVHPDLRIEALQALLRRHRLRHSQLSRLEQDLALQIGEFHAVAVEQAEGADTGGRQVECRRGSQAAGADH